MRTTIAPSASWTVTGVESRACGPRSVRRMRKRMQKAPRQVALFCSNGAEDEMSGHCRDVCPNRVMRCTLKCGENVKACSTAHQERSCRMRKPLSYGMWGKYCFLRDEPALPSKIPQTHHPLPLGCGKQFIAERREYHEAKLCLLRVVPCRSHGVRLKFQDRPTHEKFQYGQRFSVPMAALPASQPAFWRGTWKMTAQCALCHVPESIVRRG